MEDCKLQAVDTGSRPGKIEYGSKEDDNSALRCLAEIEITNDQARENMVSLIVKSLENSANVNFIFLFLNQCAFYTNYLLNSKLINHYTFCRVRLAPYDSSC